MSHRRSRKTSTRRAIEKRTLKLNPQKAQVDRQTLSAKPGGLVWAKDDSTFV